MPFIVIPETGVIEGKPELHQTLSEAKDVAERTAIRNPDMKYLIFATVSSVFVPAPQPVWNVETYATEFYK